MHLLVCPAADHMDNKALRLCLSNAFRGQWPYQAPSPISYLRGESLPAPSITDEAPRPAVPVTSVLLKSVQSLGPEKGSLKKEVERLLEVDFF